MNADVFFLGAARHIVFFPELPGWPLLWRVGRSSDSQSGTGSRCYSAGSKRGLATRDGIHWFVDLTCFMLLRCSANVERWGNLRWLWNALWPQLPFAFQHGRDGKMEMRWKGESLFRASCVNPNSGMWCNLCLPLLLPLQFSYNFQFEIFLHFIILYPKTSKCPGFSDSLILFNRFDVISHESRKPKRPAVHSAVASKFIVISGQVSRLMENLKKGGTREDPCKVTLHECMHIVPAYVIHACPSTIRQNDIHCFAYTHKIGFYWGKQSLIGPILH